MTNFDNTDIRPENGTLTAVSTGDGGVTWTGTFTPTDNIEDTTNIISVGTSLTDLAGNAPLAGNDSANYRIDTIEPVPAVFSNQTFEDLSVLTFTDSKLYENSATEDDLAPGVEVPAYEKPTENSVAENEVTLPVDKYSTLQGSTDSDTELVHVQDPEIEQKCGDYLSDR